MRVFLVCSFLLAPLASSAQLVTVTYTEFVRQLSAQIDEVAKARRIDEPDTYLARQVASAWYYLGPCKGDARKVENSNSVLQWVTNAKPSRPVGAAALEIIAILSRTDFGRPSEYTCRFALETAAPLVRDK
jgi:hypothetical protein